MIGRLLRMEWHETDTPAALKEAYLSQRDVGGRTRLHALCLIRSGWQIKAAAEAVGVHYRSAQRWVESMYGVKFKGNSIYSVLQRLGCSSKVPRSRHEKADVEAQESWKKGGLVVHLGERAWAQEH